MSFEGSRKEWGGEDQGCRSSRAVAREQLVSTVASAPETEPAMSRDGPQLRAGANPESRGREGVSLGTLDPTGGPVPADWQGGYAV